MEVPTLIALLGTMGAFAAAAVALFNNERNRRAAKKVAETTKTLDGIQIQMEGWEPLVENQRIEIDRLRIDLVNERKISQAFAGRNTRLQEEVDDLRRTVDYCRRNHFTEEG